MGSMGPKWGWLSGWLRRPSPGRSVDETVMTIVDVAVDQDVGVMADMSAGVGLVVAAVVGVELEVFDDTGGEAVGTDAVGDAVGETVGPAMVGGTVGEVVGIAECWARGVRADWAGGSR